MDEVMREVLMEELRRLADKAQQLADRLKTLTRGLRQAVEPDQGTLAALLKDDGKSKQQERGVFPKTLFRHLTETGKAAVCRVPGTSADVAVPLSRMTEECRETIPKPGGTWTLAFSRLDTNALQRIEEMLAGTV